MNNLEYLHVHIVPQWITFQLHFLMGESNFLPNNFMGQMLDVQHGHQTRFNDVYWPTMLQGLDFSQGLGQPFQKLCPTM